MHAVKAHHPLMLRRRQNPPPYNRRRHRPPPHFRRYHQRRRRTDSACGHRTSCDFGLHALESPWPRVFRSLRVCTRKISPGVQ